MSDHVEKQGQFRFNVNFDVDASEMKDWQPERMVRFFRGIAMMLNARAGSPEDREPITQGEDGGAA